MFENVDGRTDDRVIGILIAHIGTFGSGELKCGGGGVDEGWSVSLDPHSLDPPLRCSLLIKRHCQYTPFKWLLFFDETH